METIIITPKNQQALLFLKQLLSELSSVKSLKVVNTKKEIAFVSLSESSLNKEWNSPEDAVWDSWAKTKLKKSPK